MNVINDGVDKDSFNFYENNYNLIFLYLQRKTKGGYNTFDLVNNQTKTNKLWYFIDSKKKCRFCGKDESNTTFSTKAHAFSEVLGNKMFINKNFECDSCNNYFGIKYENELENFLHHLLVIDKIKGKEKPKKYEFTDKTSSFEWKDDCLQITEIVGNNKFLIDENKKEFTYEFDIPKYSIIKVYKSLLKMALSALPENKIENFKIALSLVKDDSLIGGEYIATAFFPGFNRFEFTVVGYERKNSVQDLPAYQFAIMNGNFLLQIPIYSDSDISLLNDKCVKIDLYIIPTPFDTSKIGNRMVSMIKVDENYSVPSKLTATFKYDSSEQTK